MGDFVINSRSDRKGSAGISDLPGSVSVISTVLTPRVGLNSRFVHYLLRSQPFQEEYYRFGTGIVADLWSTRYSSMKRITLAVPPPEEQSTIAGFLDRETEQIDNLIGKQERLVELLAEKRQAVITHAVTKGLDPTAPTKPSGIPWLGNIPVHWTVSGVKHLGRTASGAGFPHEFQGDESQTIPFHKVSSLATADEAGIVSSRRDTVSHEVAMKLRAEVFPAGSLVLAKIGAALLLGRIRMLSEPSCIDNNMMAVCISKQASPRFVYYALQQVDFKMLVNPGAVPSLSDRTFRAYKLAWPPLSEQAAIASKLDTQLARLDELQNKAQNVIRTLKERRRALISAAVTGKIEVQGQESHHA